MKWVGILAAVVVIISCFFPWINIESRGITITGIDATGTNFGKPGYMNILLSVLFIIFSIISRVWSKRVNLFISALNFAWAIRNLILLARCEGGECPSRQSALYVLFIASIIMMVALIATPLTITKEQDTPST